MFRYLEPIVQDMNFKVGSLFKTTQPRGLSDRIVNILSASINSRATLANSIAASLPYPVGGSTKRFMDIAISVIVMLSLSPLFLMTVLIVYIFSGRPIFFSHERVGFQGKKFLCHKFRTMCVNSQEVLADHLEANPQARNEWELNRKLKNDPRITSIGSFLRKSSIDELPQLYNVLVGEMTCVGPRPVVEAELAQYGISAKYYKMSRPGITGLWQVRGRNTLSYRTRVIIDRLYITKWSATLDIQILAETIPAVLRSNETA